MPCPTEKTPPGRVPAADAPRKTGQRRCQIPYLTEKTPPGRVPAAHSPRKTIRRGCEMTHSTTKTPQQRVLPPRAARQHGLRTRTTPRALTKRCRAPAKRCRASRNTAAHRRNAAARTAKRCRARRNDAVLLCNDSAHGRMTLRTGFDSSRASAKAGSGVGLAILAQLVSARRRKEEASALRAAGLDAESNPTVRALSDSPERDRN